MKTRITTALTLAFNPSELIVIDDSESHRGHGGFREGGETHFNVKIRSSKFANMTRVAAHRAVMSQLKTEFNDGLHALSLDLGAS
ncbi:MAG: BolA family protein [Amylibacter sp.]|jgi:BolA protein|tara:strand:- start:10873 stop:11127 length:255 start_codon:yes stop_codon:yes gene_type:complete